MTDKIKKFLEKLSAKELIVVQATMSKIIAGEFEGLNIVQLKGSANVFRVRKGRLRIIYTVDKAGNANILSVDRRSEKTYKNL